MKVLKFFENIPIHYEITAADAKMIASNPDWTHKSVSNFKAAVRLFLGNIQLWRCAYCRKPIEKRFAANAIEHIVDKDEYDDFKYKPDNLVLSCWACNAKKRQARSRLLSDVGKSKAMSGSLPDNTSDYCFVHPYIDSFSNHVVIYASWVFQPINNLGRLDVKGIQHIEVFGLGELWEIERRSRLSRLFESNSTLGLYGTAVAIGIQGETNWSHILKELKKVKAAKKRKELYYDLDQLMEELPKINEDKNIMLLQKPTE